MSQAQSQTANSGVDNRSIEELLRSVGEYQLQGYRTLTRADIAVKDDTAHGYSVVTEYDLESERRIHDYIAANFPGDSFLGEEHGNVRRDPRRYWILDPIDGTSNFTQGVPFWGPSLALWDAEGPARGWIHFPALGQMFYGERGRGAFLDGLPLRSSTVEKYSNLTTVGTVSRFHRRFRLRCPAKHRILGSIVVNLAYLATGSFAAIFCRGSVWDLAAGLLIAAEAGAVFDCDPDIRKLDIAAMDPRSAPSITVHAMANRKLPHLRDYITPYADPVTGE